MTSDVTTRYAKTGDVHIAYQVTGQGPLDLLLLPDGQVPIDAINEEPSFDRFVRRLGGFCRVIRYDRQGTGLSDPVTPGNPPTLEQWAGDAEAVLDAVGSERTALLGLAEGGFVVAMLAATRPDRVSGLVFVNGTPGISAEPFRHWGLAAAAHDRLQGTIGDDPGEVEWGIPLFAPSAVGDERYRTWLERSMRRSVAPAGAVALFDVLYESDIRDVLPVITAPTLVIHRKGNRYLTPEHGRYLAGRIPDARYEEVGGDDHVPYLGDTTPILDAIEVFLTGGKRRAEAGRVLSAVLFTDIVGSTKRAAEMGDDRWRELLLAHHELVRRELAEFGGREIDTAGDGFFAAFDGPARAVRCAAAVVDAVRRLGVEVRAGVHIGECEVLDDKLGGIAVHIGSRIAAIAGPGEILASSTVKDLVAGSGLVFEDRGMHALKGVPEEWHLYAVIRDRSDRGTWPAVTVTPSDDPPPRA